MMSALEFIGNNLTLVVGIVLMIGTVLGWLYRNLNKAYKIKRDNETFHEMVMKHDCEIGGINEKVDKIIESMAKHEEQNKKVDCSILRDRIIDSYKKNKESGSNTIGALDYENLNEMFTQYFARGGNHLVSHLHEDFKTWSVVFEEN